MPTASTGTDDLVGTAAADWHDESALDRLLVSKGFEAHRWWPLCMEFHADLSMGASRIFVVVRAVDRSACGQTFEELEAYAKKRKWSLPVVELEVGQVDLAALLPLFHRFEVTLRPADRYFPAQSIRCKKRLELGKRPKRTIKN